MPALDTLGMETHRRITSSYQCLSQYDGS